MELKLHDFIEGNNFIPYKHLKGWKHRYKSHSILILKHMNVIGQPEYLKVTGVGTFPKSFHSMLSRLFPDHEWLI